MTGASIDVGEVPAFAQRISYVGELGYELYGPIEMGARLWDTLWAAGREDGLIAAGFGAFDSLRLEKGYRLWGQDIGTEHDPFEAGLGFAVRMDKDFQGREALEAIRARGSAEKLVPMVFDDPRTVVMGKEPVWAGGRVVGNVTSANYGYSVGRGIVYGYLPVDARRPGHAGRGRVLRRAARRHGDRRARCGTPRANDCGREHHRSRKEDLPWRSSTTRGSCCTRGSASRRTSTRPATTGSLGTASTTTRTTRATTAIPSPSTGTS